MDLVTGGTGIVGAHAIDALLEQGRAVRVLLRPGSDPSIVRRILRHYRPDGEERFGRIAWAEGDLFDAVALRDAMQGAEHVYHCAAMVSFDPRDAQQLHRVNAEGTANVVDAALEAGVKRLCHVSSTAAVGTPAQGREADEALPFVRGKRTSAYAISKAAAEMEVHRGIAEGLDAVMVNPGVVIGPGMPGRSSMQLMERLRRGTRWHPTGTNGFVDARDVAAWMVAVAARGATGERYLLVGENAGYQRLFSLVCEAAGHPAPPFALRRWMLGLAWRAERLRTLAFGGSPLVTRSTASTAMGRRAYRAAKAEALAGQRFRSLEEAVSNTVSFMAGA